MGVTFGVLYFSLTQTEQAKNIRLDHVDVSRTKMGKLWYPQTTNCGLCSYYLKASTPLSSQIPHPPQPIQKPCLRSTGGVTQTQSLSFLRSPWCLAIAIHTLCPLTGARLAWGWGSYTPVLFIPSGPGKGRSGERLWWGAHSQLWTRLRETDRGMWRIEKLQGTHSPLTVTLAWGVSFVLFKVWTVERCLFWFWFWLNMSESEPNLFHIRILIDFCKVCRNRGKSCQCLTTRKMYIKIYFSGVPQMYKF